jgi:hypothetical protein
MGIIHLPEKKYKCRKCGSLNCKPYQEPPSSRYAGHYEGVVCLDCGNTSRHYKKSVYEEEMGSGSYSKSFDDVEEF